MRTWRHLFLLFAGLMLCACGASTSTPAPAPLQSAALSPLPSDDVLIGKVYAPAVSQPDDFLRDTTNALTGAFTLRHIRSVDLDERAAVSAELCSDEITDAMRWSDDADARRALGGPLLSVLDTARYYEMTRQIDALPEWVAIERVFKCAYFDRAGADATALKGPAGQFNQVPLNPAALRELAEYLWQFSSFNNPGNAVLASVASPAASGLRHTLTLAALGRMATGCDHIDVFDWHFDATADGQLVTRLDPVMQVFSHSKDGIASVCKP